MEDFEKFFCPDNFTEEAMPLSSMLCRLFHQEYCNIMSDKMSACVGKYSDMNDEFFWSLNEQQKELFHKLGYMVGEVTEIDLTEHFNKGFRLGAMLMAEVFGESFFIRPEHHQ